MRLERRDLAKISRAKRMITGKPVYGSSRYVLRNLDKEEEAYRDCAMKKRREIQLAAQRQYNIDHGLD